MKFAHLFNNKKNNIFLLLLLLLDNSNSCIPHLQLMSDFEFSDHILERLELESDPYEIQQMHLQYRIRIYMKYCDK